MANSLIIGGSGLVGNELMRQLPDAVGTYSEHSPGGNLHHLDIRDRIAVGRTLSVVQPKTVYLCAALTHVDYCEMHPDESYAVNVQGVKNVMDAANANAMRVVYISTDYIFDGKSGPYHEWDAANPLSVYGKHKLAAEHYILSQAGSYLIVRTTWLYGPEVQNKNFIARLLSSLDPLDVPCDQFATPTYVPDLVTQLIATDIDGILNLAGSDVVSRYQFALQACDIFGHNRKLTAVKTSELRQPAARPLKAGLADGGLPGIEDSLRRMRDYSTADH